MKLSIITINYNNKAGLEKTIASVMQQTWRSLTPSPSPNGEGSPWEWILIDGGSTDGSKEVIEELAKDPASNISYWCSEPDKGVYNAMNKGIAKARGEYLQFLNSGDCLHDNNVFEKVSGELNGEEVIYGNIDFVSETNRNTFLYPERLTTHYFLYRSLGHPATFIKSELLKNVGYREDFKIVSDWYQFLKWFREGKHFKHIDYIIADFDTTGISTTNQDVLAKEQESTYIELFGKQNIEWIKESIDMQKLKEKNEINEYQLLDKIRSKGGRRYSYASSFLSLINKTIK